jgi:hypothetical protein
VESTNRRTPPGWDDDRQNVRRLRADERNLLVARQQVEPESRCEHDRDLAELRGRLARFYAHGDRAAIEPTAEDVATDRMRVAYGGRSKLPVAPVACRRPIRRRQVTCRPAARRPRHRRTRSTRAAPPGDDPGPGGHAAPEGRGRR